jgi:nicotinamidase-related amidase
MKLCFIFLFLLFGFHLSPVHAQKDTSSTALLLIDIQNLYFTPADGALVKPEEAATRAGHDFGFDCTVLSDACSTRDLKFGEKIISAEAVQSSTLATLTFYAKITDVDTYLRNNK